jgi:hypothetical protein
MSDIRSNVFSLFAFVFVFRMFLLQPKQARNERIYLKIH